MFITKGYGFSIADIDQSCPKEMEFYEKAYQHEVEQTDVKAWMFGRYTYVAFGSVLAQAFGKKSYRQGDKSAAYPEIPFMQQNETREMTKEEFDALPPDEKERVLMQVIENAMSGAVEGFNKKKESEGGENG